MALSTLSLETIALLTGAAEDAFDFKQRDPASITTMLDCVQARFEHWEGLTHTAFSRVVRVKEELNAIGIRF